MPQPFSEAEVDALIEKRPLCLALDSVRDPGNLGTIVRVADWFGIDAVFASPDTVELFNPKTVQATMGAVFRRRVVYCDLVEVAGKFRKAGMPVYGTFLDGEDIYSQPLEQHGLIVMGSESNGIGPKMARCVSHRLFIPPYPRDAAGSESLNVAIAAAVTCALFRK
jgi:TrmH family RNA methyltransferase